MDGFAKFDLSPISATSIFEIASNVFQRFPRTWVLLIFHSGIFSLNAVLIPLSYCRPEMASNVRSRDYLTFSSSEPTLN